MEIGFFDLRERETETSGGVVFAVAVDDIARAFRAQRRIDAHEVVHQFPRGNAATRFELRADFAVERGRGRRFEHERVGDEPAEEDSCRLCA